VVTRRLQAERRTDSVRRLKTGVTPTVLRNKPGQEEREVAEDRPVEPCDWRQPRRETVTDDGTLLALTDTVVEGLRGVDDVGVGTRSTRWRSGVAVVRRFRSTKLNLRRARLVLGWVTVPGFNSRCTGSKCQDQGRSQYDNVV